MSEHASQRQWLALDIGGANIKAAHQQGKARALPFELWKRPDDLSRILGSLMRTFPPCDGLVVTMTAELCDCYATKAIGVNAVLDAVEKAAAQRPILVWSIDGQLHPVAKIRQEPALAAAANWLALASVAARLVPKGPGILIDIGTTTADLIPLLDGKPAAVGRTDTQRLQTGELVYAGVRRTPVAALATKLPYRGVPTGLAAELFASTLDVYVTLGQIPLDPNDLSTCDGRPRTLDAARDRLARMVGADRSDFSEDDALEFAQGADQALMDRLLDAGKTCCVQVIGRPKTAVVAGSGEFLARRLAQKLLAHDGVIVGLNEAWGEVASVAGCAHALVILASESSSC